MKAFKAFVKPFDSPQTNQLTGFYARATLAFNRLMYKTVAIKHNFHEVLC